MSPLIARHGAVVLDAIHRGEGHLSKVDLHRQTGIPWGTLCRIVDALVDQKLISLRIEKRTGRGRPTQPLSLVEDSAHFIGLDVGAALTKCVVCALGGRVIGHLETPTPRYAGKTVFFRRLSAFTEQCLAPLHLPKKRVLGLGLSISGTVDSEHGLIVSGGNFGLSRGEDLPIDEWFPAGIPCTSVVNTQAAAAWGEFHYGSHAGRSHLVTIGLGVGIGSGVVSNRQLLRSHPTRQIGYIGHLLMPDHQRPCVCGFRGCLEAYSGGHSLVSVAAEKHLPFDSAETLDRAALSGDPGAREILDRAANYNAVGVANMVQLYSPEAILFSGSQSRENGYLFPQTLKALGRILPEERRRSLILARSSLGIWQSARGAARIAFEQYFSNPRGVPKAPREKRASKVTEGNSRKRHGQKKPA
jgi:predicted NBD/HSP70 family sugar kinase